MKRNTPDHPKVADLADRLKVEQWGAVGILESLWHFTAKYAPDGCVGRFAPIAIAKGISWRGDSSILIDALRSSRWLDHEGTELTVHDWSEHADDAVHMMLARSGRLFADGSLPNMRRLTKSERESILTKYGDMFETNEQSHLSQRCPTSRAHKVCTGNALPNPKPMPEPVPIPKPNPDDPPTNCNGVLLEGCGTFSEVDNRSVMQASDSRCLNGIGHSDADAMGSKSRSDALPVQNLTRASARPIWMTRVMVLFAPKGSSQWQSDRTSAERLFDSYVWPEDELPTIGHRRMQRVPELVKHAARRANRMAWLTTRVKDGCLNEQADGAAK